jgi:hypothetical protein
MSDEKLNAARDARAAPVRVKLQLHTITDEHFYSMQTHLPCEVCEYYLTISQLHTKKCVRERLIDDPFYNFFIGHICVEDNSSNWQSRQVIEPFLVHQPLF